jgi:putative transposase
VDATDIGVIGTGNLYFISEKERIRRYRRYVYEAGAVNRPEKGKTKVIGDKMLEKERNRGFELNRSDRFRYRTRYFTDSGIIGSKEFVAENYQRFKHLFYSKHEKSQNRSRAWRGCIR